MIKTKKKKKNQVNMIPSKRLGVAKTVFFLQKKGKIMKNFSIKEMFVMFKFYLIQNRKYLFF